ncbi:MAG: efflux RND transporter periplasmic adaptor subunit [candidate division Zixibacteria bacterium]
MKKTKTLFWIIGSTVVIGASLLFFYINGLGDEPDRSSPRYKEFEVTRGTFKVVVSASGVVSPKDRIEIKSKASGRIIDMPVEEGDLVSQNDLICRLDQTDVQAEVDQTQADLDIAQAELKQAQNNFNRRQQLFEKKLISPEELDESKLALAQAKGKLVRVNIALSQAETRLSETIVTAPVTGIILKKYVEAGQIIASGISNVSGGSPIADIADMHAVYIEAGVDEIDIGKIEVGQSARVVAEAYPTITFHGEIIRVAPEAKVEQNVTLFDVVVEVANEAGRLKSGMNGTVEVTIVEKTDVILAPTVALTPGRGKPSDGKMMTAMIKEDGRFVAREVEIGLTNFRNTIILSGLSEGDILGVPMVSRLKDANDRLEQRIRSTRSFGASNSKPKSGSR